MRLINTILIIFLFLLAVTFSLQNADEVTIHYYGLMPPLTAPLFIAVLAAVSLGIIIGAAGALLNNVQLRMKLRRQKKKIHDMKTEQQLLKGEVTRKPELPPFL
jgi:uncharacterized integral membrane protein